MIPLLDAAARQAASLQWTAHRPWPVPAEPWLQGQTWQALLFAHWPVPAERLSSHVPAALAVEEHGGSAWLGVTPFRVAALRLRGTLPLPLLSTFVELNVRTYVSDGERPGIWFLSLDASSRLAVEAARRLYRLPYHHARLELRERDGWIECSCSRRGSERPYVFEARYRPRGSVVEPAAGSLERFLVERYCLYALDAGGRLARAEIHHPPWALYEAEAEIDLNTMPPEGLEPAGGPLLHFARRQDVLIWPLRPLTRRGARRRGRTGAVKGAAGAGPSLAPGLDRRR